MLGLVVQVAFAAPPAIEYLSDVSIEGLWQGPSRQWPYNDECLKGRLIVLVGASEDIDPDSTWGIFNDPAIKDYITQEQITLIFYQDEQSTVKSLVDGIGYLHTGSRLLIREASGDFLKKRWYLAHWPKHQPSSEEVLAWIKDPAQMRWDLQRTFRERYSRFEQDPSDTQLRFQLIEQCEGLGGYPEMANHYVPGLLLHNQSWYEYECGFVDDHLTEKHFRKMVFERIRYGRETLELFAHLMPQPFRSKETDTWFYRVTFGNAAVFGQGIQTAQSIMIHKWASLCKDLAELVDLGTATDRDRFILNALTAEGEEWQQLVEQYERVAPLPICCLDDTDMRDIIDETAWEHQPVLLILDDAKTQPEDWKSSVWNDPQLCAFMSKNNIRFVWADPDIDNYYFDMMKAHGELVIRYWDARSFMSIQRYGLSRFDTAESTIEWLEAALSGSSLIHEMFEELRANPEDIALRWKTHTELCRQAPRAGEWQRGLLPLLRDDEGWFVFMQKEFGLDEQSFRSHIVELIAHFRQGSYLFEPEETTRDSAGWESAMSYVDNHRTITWGKGAAHKIDAVRFRRELESQIADGTATDRDRFILNALTAEGEEWQALVEQYSYDSP